LIRGQLVKASVCTRPGFVMLLKFDNPTDGNVVQFCHPEDTSVTVAPNPIALKVVKPVHPNQAPAQFSATIILDVSKAVKLVHPFQAPEMFVAPVKPTPVAVKLVIALHPFQALEQFLASFKTEASNDVKLVQRTHVPEKDVQFKRPEALKLVRPLHSYHAESHVETPVSPVVSNVVRFGHPEKAKLILSRLVPILLVFLNSADTNVHCAQVKTVDVNLFGPKIAQSNPVNAIQPLNAPSMISALGIVPISVVRDEQF